jgi:hypothetical protein
MAFEPLLPAGASPAVSPAAIDTSALTAPDPGRLDAAAILMEPAATATPTPRPRPATPAVQPSVQVTVIPKPTTRPTPVRTAPPAVGTISTGKGYTLSGWASWYDNGTTAMRLPRGTHVRICGPATCVDRTVTDYGPDASVFPNRIVDMMPTDFATVCGCSPSKGTVRVTVTVYA